MLYYEWAGRLEAKSSHASFIKDDTIDSNFLFQQVKRDI